MNRSKRNDRNTLPPRRHDHLDNYNRTKERNDKADKKRTEKKGSPASHSASSNPPTPSPSRRTFFEHADSIPDNILNTKTSRHPRLPHHHDLRYHARDTRPPSSSSLRLVVNGHRYFLPVRHHPPPRPQQWNPKPSRQARSPRVDAARRGGCGSRGSSRPRSPGV